MFYFKYYNVHRIYIICFFVHLCMFAEIESSTRRRYEFGVHPKNFCPKSKVCPPDIYRMRSSYYQFKSCGHSSECNDYEICCLDLCSHSRFCSKSMSWIDDHDGECPRITQKCKKKIILRPRCHHDTDCYLDAKCCLDPCLMSTVCFQIQEQVKKNNKVIVFDNRATIIINDHNIRQAIDHFIVETETKIPAVDQDSSAIQYRHHGYPEVTQIQGPDLKKIQEGLKKQNLYEDPMLDARLHAVINLGAIDQDTFSSVKNFQNLNKDNKNESLIHEELHKELIFYPEEFHCNAGRGLNFIHNYRFEFEIIIGLAAYLYDLAFKYLF